MEVAKDKRTRFRRFEDRRVALMLAIHEALFNDAAGNGRDTKIIEHVRKNFQADRIELLSPVSQKGGRLAVMASAGQKASAKGRLLEGAGIEALLGLQRDAPGALALIKVKRPSPFDPGAWEELWARTLNGEILALLSIRISPERADPALIWIMQSSHSREWSSRDRELIEEVVSVLARARDKEMDLAQARAGRS